MVGAAEVVVVSCDVVSVVVELEDVDEEGGVVGSDDVLVVVDVGAIVDEDVVVVRASALVVVASCDIVSVVVVLEDVDEEGGVVGSDDVLVVVGFSTTMDEAEGLGEISCAVVEVSKDVEVIPADVVVGKEAFDVVSSVVEGAPMLESTASVDGDIGVISFVERGVDKEDPWHSSSYSLRIDASSLWAA